jgi:hypothetical protein
MKTLSKLSTPAKLADELIKQLRKRNSFTIDASTGDDAQPCNLTIGGMIRPYGQLDALYYSPSGTVNRDDLINQLTQNWQAIKIYGYLGVWTCESEIGNDLFIDSVYLVPCGCDSYAGPSMASLDFAVALGGSNDQISIGHLCHTEPNGFREIKL